MAKELINLLHSYCPQIIGNIFQIKLRFEMLVFKERGNQE